MEDINLPSELWLKMKEESRKRLEMLAEGVGFWTGAHKLEEPDTKLQLAVILTKPDGTGRIVARFDSPEFLEDLAKVCGFKNFDELRMSGVKETRETREKLKNEVKDS